MLLDAPDRWSAGDALVGCDEVGGRGQEEPGGLAQQSGLVIVSLYEVPVSGVEMLTGLV